MNLIVCARPYRPCHPLRRALFNSHAMSRR